jgi:hypothetical protein
MCPSVECGFLVKKKTANLIVFAVSLSTKTHVYLQIIIALPWQNVNLFPTLYYETGAKHHGGGRRMAYFA